MFNKKAEPVLTLLNWQPIDGGIQGGREGGQYQARRTLPHTENFFLGPFSCQNKNTVCTQLVPDNRADNVFQLL